MDTANIWSPQFIISLGISFVMSFGFIWWQWYVYKDNRKAIFRLSRFFSKREAYSTYESFDNDENGNAIKKSVKIREVAEPDAELKNLIDDINVYIKKSNCCFFYYSE